jgi:DNA-binding NarL/FixJ family response regulator
VGENARTAVLYDRQPMWLEAIEGVLERANVRVEGKVADIATAVALIGDQKPDLFVTDAVGTEAGATIDFDHLHAAQAQAPGIKCIVLASNDDKEMIEAAFAAGAVAYVLKSAHPDDLASAVRQAFRQSIYVGHGAVRAAVIAAPRWNAAATGLTKRERQILCLVAEGHSNAQLAGMLWVTEQTVKFHLSNVYRKIDVANRTEAARWAQLHGLLSSGDHLPISA